MHTQLSISALSLLLHFTTTTAATTQTLIPSTVFNDYTTLETYFSYLYPWGSDHNGAARMIGNSSFHEYIFLTDKTLNLLSVPAPPGQPNSVNTPSVAISYFSGTVYATQHFAVNKTGDTLTFEADFVAPVARGTWPAFWLTAVVGWPPEADMAEWKGTGDISFNTFNTSSIVDAVNVDYPNPTESHSIKTIMKAEDDSNVVLQYFLDGKLISTQYGADFVGAALWLIIDFQMLGSSGSPGPTGNTTYSISNLSVTQTTS